MDEHSEGFLNGLGFTLIDTIDSGYSVWSHFEIGRIFIPLNTKVHSTMDLIKVIQKDSYDTGYTEGKKYVKNAVSNNLFQLLLKDVDCEENEDISYA